MTTTQSKQSRFMELLKPVQPNLERFVLAMTRDTETARDITAETILVAFERFETLRNPQAFLSFLFTIAVRIHRKQRNRAQRTAPLDQEILPDIIAPDTPPDIAADISALYRALQSLPEKQREAVVLFEITGLRMKEIREIQGGTLTAVKVRISRGRKKLAEVLGVNERALNTGTRTSEENQSVTTTHEFYSIGIQS